MSVRERLTTEFPDSERAVREAIEDARPVDLSESLSELFVTGVTQRLWGSA
jgi:hypothetical protein